MSNENDIEIDRRIDIILADKIQDISRSKIQEAIKNFKSLKINSIFIKKPNHTIKPGDDIEFNYEVKIREQSLPEEIPLSIIFEDEYLLVINKDINISTHPSETSPSGSLVNALMFRGSLDIEHYEIEGKVYRPGVVHRLDKDTSGAIMFAKNTNIQTKLSALFKDRKIKKKYICLTHGEVKEDKGVITYPIGRNKMNRKVMCVQPNGKPSITAFRVIERNANFSLMEIDLKTGRTHQIRAHMKAINHPVAGDTLYSHNNSNISRLMLHSYSLIAPLKKDFEEILFNLGISAISNKLAIDI